MPEPTVVVIPNSPTPSESSEPVQPDNTPLLMLSQQVSNLTETLQQLVAGMTALQEQNNSIVTILENLQAEVEPLEVEAEEEPEAELTVIEAELPPITEPEVEKPESVSEEQEPNWMRKALFG